MADAHDAGPAGLEAFGGMVLAWATAALCAAALLLGDPEGILFPKAWRGPALTAALIVTILAAVVTSLQHRSRLAWYPIVAFWAAQIISGVLEAFGGAVALTSLVTPAQAVVATLAAASLCREPPRKFLSPALAGASALMLFLFGLVHFQNAAFIAGLVPSWLPGRTDVPFATGTLQIISAAGLILPSSRRYAALGTAAMFGSWLPLVHASRLASAPVDLGEWRFALTALVLTAVLAIAAARVREGDHS